MAAACSQSSFPRHFPAFAATNHLGGGFRIPEEPSNAQHRRHLLPYEGSSATATATVPFVRSYSPEQLITDAQSGLQAAEDLYTSTSCGKHVFHHIYPGLDSPPATVQLAAAEQQEEAQRAWVTTTFRSKLSLKHSSWDHDGTDFTAGYATQKLIGAVRSSSARQQQWQPGSSQQNGGHGVSPGASNAAARDAANNGHGRSSSSSMYDDAGSSEDWDAEEDPAAPGGQDATGEARPSAIAAAAAATLQQQTLRGRPAKMQQQLPAASRSTNLQQQPTAANGPTNLQQQPTATKRSSSPSSGLFPDSWFSNTPVGVLAAEREAARQKEVALLAQFHPQPGIKFPERSKAMHRQTWAESAQQEWEWEQLAQQQEQQQLQLVGSATTTEAAAGAAKAWGAQRDSRPASGRKHSSQWMAHQAAAYPASAAADESKEDHEQQGYSDVESEHSNSSTESACGAASKQDLSPHGYGRELPSLSAIAAVPAGASADQLRAAGAPAAAAAAAAAPWWAGNPKLAKLVQQMLISPAQANLDAALLPDTQDAAAAAAPAKSGAAVVGLANSCCSSDGKSRVGNAASAAINQGMPPSQTWAVYCNQLQQLLAAAGSSDVTAPNDPSASRSGKSQGAAGSSSTSTGVLGKPAALTTPSTEQQRAAWVAELVERPVWERMRLLEMHVWAANSERIRQKRLHSTSVKRCR